MDGLKKRLVVFDLETTNAPERDYRHEVIEIAAIEIMEGKINTNDAFHSLVKPPCRIQSHNYRVSGISDDMVKDAPVIDRVLPGFLDFIRNDPLIAHGMSFDSRVLNEQTTALGYNKVSNLLLDTLTLSRKIHKREKTHSLDVIMQRLGIKPSIKHRHRALGDVECTAMVFLNFLEILKQSNITMLEDINRLCNTDCDIDDLQQFRLF